MNVGDRVKHRKYGLGTIKALYAKHDACRVVYDSGHETTNAQKRVEVVPADWGKPREEGEPVVSPPPTESARTRRGGQGGGGTTKVDYKLLDRMLKHFQAEFPDADRIIPRIYGERAYCEVFDSDGLGRVWFYDEATPGKKRRA
jgi:hypothetical protein